MGQIMYSRIHLISDVDFFFCCSNNITDNHLHWSLHILTGEYNNSETTNKMQPNAIPPHLLTESDKKNCSAFITRNNNNNNLYLSFQVFTLDNNHYRVKIYFRRRHLINIQYIYIYLSNGLCCCSLLA